jgi:hypothetical protein
MEIREREKERERERVRPREIARAHTARQHKKTIAKN